MADKLIETDGFINVENVIEGESENITDMQNDIDSQMNKLFEEFGGDDNDVEFKIHVKRAIPGKGEMEVCFQCTAAELPITDRIIRDFGHGTYEIWIYKNGKRFRKRTLHIAKPLRPTATALNPTPAGGDVARLINVMAENQRQSMEQLQAMINTKPAASVDIPGLITAAVPVIGLLKEVLTPPKAPDTMETFLKAAEFMNSIKSDSGGDNEGNFYSMVSSLTKSLAPGIIEMSKNLPQPAPGQSAPGQSAPGQPALAQPAQPVPDSLTVGNTMEPNPEITVAEKAQLKQYVFLLTGMAAQNKDPLLYADLILDQLGDDYIQRYILRDDFIPFLSGINPAVASHVEWFERLKSAVASAYVSPDGAPEGLQQEQPLTNNSDDANNSNVTVNNPMARPDNGINANSEPTATDP